MRSWRRSAARTVGLVLVTAALAGCAAAQTNLWAANPQSDCERRGGAWRAKLGLCEYQSGGGGM